MPNHKRPAVGDEYVERSTGQKSRWNGKAWVTTEHDRVLPASTFSGKPAIPTDENGTLVALEVKDINIFEWCPTPDGSGPPTQVHLVANYYGLPKPIVWRFKGPEYLGQIIAILTRYRKSVWPRAPEWKDAEISG